MISVKQGYEIIISFNCTQAEQKITSFVQDTKISSEVYNST
jgi:hypothetical protein